jgi:hypothetical protein
VVSIEDSISISLSTASKGESDIISSCIIPSINFIVSSEGVTRLAAWLASVRCNHLETKYLLKQPKFHYGAKSKGVSQDGEMYYIIGAIKVL